MSDETVNYGEFEARAHALLVQMLAATTMGTVGDFALKHLKPRDEDYERAFTPDAARAAQAAYAKMWASGPTGGARPGQTAVIVTSATSEDLIQRTRRAGAFPGGYKRLGDALQPGRMWIRWKFVEPGRRTGMAYDGLVWMDDHWAWFPKPWRAIAAGQELVPDDDEYN